MCERPVNAGRLLAAAALLLAVLAVLAGCENPYTKIQKLQQDVTELKGANDRLRLQAERQKQRLDRLEGQLAQMNKMPPDRWALIPKPERLEITRYSGLRFGRPELSQSPTTQPTGAGVDMFARLYVVALDPDGFRIRAAGPVKISLFDLSGDSPRSLGVYRLDAQAAARHYRSALTNDLYAFDLPLSSAPSAGGVTARVELTDFLTGKTLTAQKALELPKR